MPMMDIRLRLRCPSSQPHCIYVQVLSWFVGQNNIGSLQHCLANAPAKASNLLVRAKPVLPCSLRLVAMQIMIAEAGSRRKGIAKEALLLMMAHGCNRLVRAAALSLQHLQVCAQLCFEYVPHEAASGIVTWAQLHAHPISVAGALPLAVQGLP